MNPPQSRQSHSPGIHFWIHIHQRRAVWVPKKAQRQWVSGPCWTERWGRGRPAPCTRWSDFWSGEENPQTETQSSPRTRICVMCDVVKLWYYVFLLLRTRRNWLNYQFCSTVLNWSRLTLFRAESASWQKSDNRFYSAKAVPFIYLWWWGVGMTAPLSRRILMTS